MGGGGDGRVKERPGQGRAASARAAVYTQPRTAEKALRGLVAPGSPDPRGLEKPFDPESLRAVPR